MSPGGPGPAARRAFTAGVHVVTTPDTEGFRSMSITVAAESEAEIVQIIGWVSQFELVSAFGSWDEARGFGEVSFYPENLESLRRLTDYVAAWDGEITPTASSVCKEMTDA